MRVGLLRAGQRHVGGNVIRMGAGPAAATFRYTALTETLTQQTVLVLPAWYRYSIFTNM